jgi:hypothetical protein
MTKTLAKLNHGVGIKERTYLAGCIDCDGFITIKRDTYKLRKVHDASVPIFYERIGFKQVKPEIVDMLYNTFGGYRSIQKPTAKNGKPLYSWDCRNLQANLCIRTIMPYLRIKKEQAELCMELRKSLEKTKRIRNPHTNIPASELELRERLFNKIKSLNDVRTHNPVLI